MLKKILSFSALTAILVNASAQDSTKGTTTFTTSVDAYYRYDFANKGNNKTSFTNSNNSFELGMASIKVDHSFGKVSATADLGFGRRAEEFSYVDAPGLGVAGVYNSLAAIKQAYISYQATSKLKITAGKWATHVGWELVDAYANRNYSMSYGFSNGPFFHTGVKADISLGGKTALMVGIANPTDYSTTTSQGKLAIAQLSTATKDDKLKVYLNYQGGTISMGPTVKLSQIDLVLNYAASSKLGVVYNSSLQNLDGKSWSTNALYLNYDPTSTFGLSWRNEIFDDFNAVKTGGTIFASTLSGNYKVGNLTIIPEFRIDNSSNKDFFLNKDGLGAKSASSFILAATYKF